MRTLKPFGIALVAAILACVNAALLAGCSRSTALANEPLPGGGAHEISDIWILDRANPTLMQDKNRPTLRVGEQMPLRVMASWTIPLVEDVTAKAKLTVDKPECGELDTNAVLTAREPGKIVIKAALRVAQRAYPEVLAPTETAGKDPVRTYESRMELTIVK
jgi:hypothetical protein